ncbi:phosphate/phosphite/phosphonate ABC transporter substrate-binding protein [Gracilibacillus sp. D59]|uniref:phosphate/phosphite/phosphonate ABC transporter substrate-binding protein n=1 Tax=Gracilibacillus sp. D59 TaxID=3457434 RepID=UPI003FCD541C
MFVRKLKFGMMFVGVLFLIAGCSGTEEAQGKEKGEWPDVLRMAKLATEDDNALARTSTAFAEDLSAELGIEIEFFESQDYTMMIEAMRAEKVDLTNFGPFGYIIAAERSGAVPIAIMGQSEESAFYTSAIVVPADSDIESLEELKGTSFLFVDPASTSGNLFPRALLLDELGLENEDLEGFFGSVAYSGGHDKSLLALANGDADAAAVAPMTIDMFAKSGMINKDDYKVIATTDPIPSAPLTYREGLPEDLVEKIKEFALHYHEQNPEYFELQGANAYYPVDDSDYDAIRDVAERLNMSPEEMLD